MALLSFDLLGVRVRLDASWLVLAMLIAWSVARDVFPAMHPGLSMTSYWAMAASTAVGVAVSILLHEMGHTLVARRYGVHVRSITLFIFGGVADLEKEPDRPWPELVIALAGPIVSVGLFAVFASAAWALQSVSPTEITGVLGYLATLNFALAAFNLAPAFPLDGGRVLRAVVWIATNDPLKATRVAARSGEIIAWAMMALGAGVLLLTGVLQGLWWLILGYFVYSLARTHRAGADAKAALSGIRVADVMTTDLVTAPADISIEQFLNEYLTPHPHALIPVLDNGVCIGAVGLKQVKAVARAQWGAARLGAIVIPLADIPTVAPHLAVEEALTQMQASRAMRVFVRGQGQLLGVLALSDIIAHLKFRNELAAT